MLKRLSYDAVIVGSGPNGLAAAITLAQAGLSVVVLESKKTIGGGMRSAELTLPGFVHDVCSAIHPLGLASPFFHPLPLAEHGLKWIHPVYPLAHPFDEGPAAILERSIETTSHTLGIDAAAYKRLLGPLVAHWHDLTIDILAPLHFPHHPFLLGRFGLLGLRSADHLINKWFKAEQARAFFAGLAAHSILPLERSLTAAFGLVLGILGHAVGWPLPRGGTQKFADALASYFFSLGGEILTDSTIEDLDDLPASRAILFDVTPRQLSKIVKHRFPDKYRKKLAEYRYGPGVFKMDWALSDPIPWKAKECLRAGTVHVGGGFNEIGLSERNAWEGKRSEKPFVLIAQPSLFDPSRAPVGKQTAWGYCHVPHGSSDDMAEQIESQIERFAPGFRDCILARSTRSALEMEAYNANCIGGDINGGVQDLGQLFSRPVSLIDPYATPVPNLFICSSSTPPGGGVHGMCGYYAAQSALKTCFR
ncbi:phytoene desaturase family protein [Candidatus Protochlamydia phocaeensis]|uniref:phytoene desaturase family protein n=1 Tax=Candidatus Protochlamydia phocaeensis TaxID=1414722 RepID=UPI0008381BF2|nr:NAD(P)/FAD-dependent oxidoreductase [Candidatus Protochlamydia phocaeensis]